MPERSGSLILPAATTALGGAALFLAKFSFGQRRRIIDLEIENGVYELAVKGLSKSRDELAEKTKKDPATGLYNKEHLRKEYDDLVNEHNHRRAADKNAHPLQDTHSLLLIDLDDFKGVNDKDGHLEGDRVIQVFADILRSSSRQRDVPTRYGGDEFALLLPRAGERDAFDKAETIRGLVEATGLVTVSIGVANIDINGSYEKNLANADTALYVAKKQGRNQVVSNHSAVDEMPGSA